MKYSNKLNDSKISEIILFKKTKNVSIILMLAILIIVSSCSQEKDFTESEATKNNSQEQLLTKIIPEKYQGLVTKLHKENGFPDDLFEYDSHNDELIYDGDIVFNEKHLIKENKGTKKLLLKNSYWVVNGVISRQNSRNITYFIDTTGVDSFPSNYRTTLRTAFANWSATHANITIMEANQRNQADVVCTGTAPENIPSDARAEWPSNNNIGSGLRLRNNYTSTQPQGLRLLMHEIGHCLGFTHSDVAEGNEVIPGTNGPTWHANNNCGSVMRSAIFICGATLQNHPWAADDTTAINYIFNDTGDADGDGIDTNHENGNDNDPTNDDSDNDNIPDYIDKDDDGDGILTQHENPDPNNDGDPSDAQDTDGDGTPDYLDTDDDGDGILTKHESVDPNDDGNPNDAQDTDNDNTANYLDTDDDGDGILTQHESPDPNNNGNPNDALDTDNNNTANYLDTDDDGDGILTLHENADPNSNGNPNDAQDTDNNNTPDYLDTDDDGDGILTTNENADPNNDGNPNDAQDTNEDGTADYLDLFIYNHSFLNLNITNYQRLRKSEPQAGVFGFFTRNWGISSKKSNNYTNATIVRDWLITPTINLRAGDIIRVTAAGTANSSSQLQIRISTVANPGDPGNGFGQYTNLVQTLTPNTGNWQDFEFTIPNSAIEGNGRANRKIALLHFAPAGGNAENIDIQSIEVEAVRR